MPKKPTLDDFLKRFVELLDEAQEKLSEADYIAFIEKAESETNRRYDSFPQADEDLDDLDDDNSIDDDMGED